MISYRKADIDDIDALTALRLQMLAEDGELPEACKDALRRNTAQYIRDGLANKSFVSWVAERDSDIIAMGGVSFIELPPNDWCPAGRTAYIGNMYTLPEYRKQGIATKLFSLLMDEARARSCERILLNASDMGRPLYEKFNFRQWPAAMAYYPYRNEPTENQQ